MALTALPTITSINKVDDGSTTVITDSTVYGGANPLRTATAVYLLAYRVDEDLEETSLTVQSFDQDDATTFTVENTIDGHQKFILLIVDDYNGATEYDRYDVVYRPADGLLYRSMSVAPITGQDPPDTTYWEVVTATELYEAIDTAEESVNLVVGIVQQVLTFAAGQCLSILASRNAKDNCCGECKNPKLKEDVDMLWHLVYVSTIASNIGEYTAGERNMRVAENYCDCC
jgi:hypothetical protein